MGHPIFCLPESPEIIVLLYYSGVVSVDVPVGSRSTLTWPSRYGSRSMTRTRSIDAQILLLAYMPYRILPTTVFSFIRRRLGTFMWKDERLKWRGQFNPVIGPSLTSPILVLATNISNISLALLARFITWLGFRRTNGPRSWIRKSWVCSSSSLGVYSVLRILLRTPWDLQ